MRLRELLVPMVKTEGASAVDAISHFESLAFRDSKEYANLYNRIAPKVKNQDVIQLLRSGGCDGDAIASLARTGFCTKGIDILSELLLDANLASITSKGPGITDLKPGLNGIEQLLDRHRKRRSSEVPAVGRLAVGLPPYYIPT
jgi:hypothetical protein